MNSPLQIEASYRSPQAANLPPVEQDPDKNLEHIVLIALRIIAVVGTVFSFLAWIAMKNLSAKPIAILFTVVTAALFSINDLDLSDGPDNPLYANQNPQAKPRISQYIANLLKKAPSPSRSARDLSVQAIELQSI